MQIQVILTTQKLPAQDMVPLSMLPHMVDAVQRTFFEPDRADRWKACFFNFSCKETKNFPALNAQSDVDSKSN